MATIKDQERTDLKQADRHIADGERNVAEQELRIEHLRADGHDVKPFEATLKTFRATLAEQCKHRDLILKRIDQIDAEEESRSGVASA